MSLILRILLAGLGGMLGGAVAGLLAALVALQARILRNRALEARGKPGLKDGALPIVFIKLGAIAAPLVAMPLAAFTTPLRAATIGALAPAGLLALIAIASAVRQMVDP